MSMIDFQAHAAAIASRDIGPLIHGELDGLLANLSQDERRDVRDMLDLIAHKLAGSSSTGRGMRRRLDAIVANLIAVADSLDGECDEEPSLGASECGRYADGMTNWSGHERGHSDECEAVSEDEGAQCDDEGQPDDNGIADADGRAEQYSGSYRWTERCE